METKTGDKPDGNWISRMEKWGWRECRKRLGAKGTARTRQMGGGLHWGSAPVSQAWFRVHDIGKGVAILEGETLSLTVGD